MGVGVLSLVGGFISDSHRAWPTLLHNAFFFMAIGLGALFFMAVQYAAEAGWSATVKRPMEAVASYLPYGSAIFGVVVILSALHVNHIYHWADTHVTDPTSQHYDSFIPVKSAVLNTVV